MKTKLYAGEMMHKRILPVEHQFNYPIYFMSIDLDELDQQPAFFSYNKFNILSINDRDYLRGQGSIREKLLQSLKNADKPYVETISKVELLTMPRYLNYIFNPVSFFYCYDNHKQLVCVVVEVSNTFAEKHLYFLDNDNQRLPATQQPLQNKGIYNLPIMQFQENKNFHVSPFNNSEGVYHFKLTQLIDKVSIDIDLHQQDQLKLATRLQVKAVPLTKMTLLAHLLKFPFTASIAMPRILWQAAQLLYRKGVKVQMKPRLSSPMTFSTAKPSALVSLRMRLVFKYLSNLKIGAIVVSLPDWSEEVFGDVDANFKVKIEIHDYSFFSNVMKNGDIGLGESYMKGHWSCSDMTSLFRLFLVNRNYLNHTSVGRNWVNNILIRIKHTLRRNSLTGSSKNIRAHYDLNNQFFEAFLDESMTYSSGIYDHPKQTLEQAQVNKLQAIIQKAQIGPEDHVLEIGSGWGSFALEAVKTTGCRVTSVTLSEEQLKYAREKVEKEGLSDRIDFQLCDYRNITGSFDKIVSIEMFEAVGHEYYGEFFKICDRLLKPNGLFVMQVITIADQYYENYRRSTDWIQAYIFPGGIVPSLTAMTKAMTKDSALVVDGVDNIGMDYARTLQDWKARFFEKTTEIKALGFDDDFFRMWEYYLCYCEAGFLTRQLGVYQMVMSRPNETITRIEQRAN